MDRRGPPAAILSSSLTSLISLSFTTRLLLGLGESEATLGAEFASVWEFLEKARMPVAVAPRDLWWDAGELAVEWLGDA